MRPPRRRRRLMAEMNVVPYIDVMLVLLIIFMVTSPMLTLTQGVEVDLPKVASKAVPRDDSAGPVIVTVNAAGAFFVTYDETANDPVTLESLLPRVAALRLAAPKRAVLVRGDAAVSHGKVVELMAALQSAGVDRVGVVTRQPEEAKPSP
jgi:biopolymer transport protein TolR